MMANQLRHRNNLATGKSISHQLKFKKLLDLSLGARTNFVDRKLQQVAQLSQRDCAAGRIGYVQNGRL